MRLSQVLHSVISAFLLGTFLFSGQACAESVGSILQHSITKCWNLPVFDQVAMAQLKVTIRFELDWKGYLIGEPIPVDYPISEMGTKVLDSAILAVRRCAPYSLPEDKYDQWRDVIITFDPKDMIK